MSAPPTQQPRSALAIAGAAAAFAVGSVAVLELLSLALPGPRGSFRTWGPIMTVLGGAGIVVIGFPVSLLVESASRRASRPRALGVVGYLCGAAVAGTALWAGWRAFVDAAAAPADLAGEFVVLGVGALTLWAGARLAERRSPAALFVFGGAGLAAVTLATALAQA